MVTLGHITIINFNSVYFTDGKFYKTFKDSIFLTRKYIFTFIRVSAVDAFRHEITSKMSLRLAEWNVNCLILTSELLFTVIFFAFNAFREFARMFFIVISEDERFNWCWSYRNKRL